MSLYAAVGSYDNLDEPSPFFNHKAAAYGFVITFLVSHAFEITVSVTSPQIDRKI